MKIDEQAMCSQVQVTVMNMQLDDLGWGLE